jgi:hypothetical protein
MAAFCLWKNEDDLINLETYEQSTTCFIPATRWHIIIFDSNYLTAIQPQIAVAE